MIILLCMKKIDEEILLELTTNDEKGGDELKTYI